jgi:hypothetical protein
MFMAVEVVALVACQVLLLEFKMVIAQYLLLALEPVAAAVH